MDNIKDKKYYIKKVLEQLYDIKENTKDVSFEEFSHNKILLSAVSFWFVQAFENAKNLNIDEFDDETKSTIIKLRGFRNLIVHEYGKVDVVGIYSISTIDVPVFIDKLEKEIKWEF